MSRRQWYRLTPARPRVARLWMAGDIGRMHRCDDAVTADNFAADLDRLPASLTDIELHIASPGGGADEGLAITDVLLRHRAQRGGDIHAWIHEVCSSTATVIVCAADRVTVSPDAEVCLHDPHSGPPETCARVRQQMIAFYQRRIARTVDDLAAMMAATTRLTAREAVDLGLATDVAPVPLPPAPFWSDSNVAAFLAPEVLQRLRAARTPVCAESGTRASVSR